MVRPRYASASGVIPSRRSRGRVAYGGPALDTARVDTPETRYARSGEVSIAYQVVGDGPFDLVWTPGALSHLELAWEDEAGPGSCGRSRRSRA